MNLCVCEYTVNTECYQEELSRHQQVRSSYDTQHGRLRRQRECVWSGFDSQSNHVLRRSGVSVVKEAELGLERFQVRVQKLRNSL